MNMEQHLLLKLMEECAEVSHRAAKQAQFGKDEIEPKLKVLSENNTNAARLRYEVNDLLAVICLLEECGEIPPMPTPELQAHITCKRLKIMKYLQYSKSLGKVV